MTAGEIRRGRRALGRPDVLLAAGLTVVLLPTSLLALVQGPSPAPPLVRILLSALFTALHILSILAARLPLSAFAAASAVMLVLAFIAGADGVPAAFYPSSFAYVLCLAQVVMQRSRLLGGGALAVGVAGAGLIAMTPVAVIEPLTRLGAFLGLAAVIAAAWAIGMLQQTSRRQAEERARMLVQQAITEERTRISRDLHDVVAHSMTVMIAQAEVARAAVRDDPAQSERALSVVVDTGREALRGMRGIVALGEEPGREPVPDIDAIVRSIDAVRSRDTELSLAETGERRPLDPAARLALQRALREALANAVRHTAAPRRVEVRMQWTGRALVTRVSDDGGSGPSQGGQGSGIGLIGVAERVRSAGGTLTAGPADTSGRGWDVRFELPCAGAGGS